MKRCDIIRSLSFERLPLILVAFFATNIPTVRGSVFPDQAVIGRLKADVFVMSGNVVLIRADEIRLFVVGQCSPYGHGSYRAAQRSAEASTLVAVSRFVHGGKVSYSTGYIRVYDRNGLYRHDKIYDYTSYSSGFVGPPTFLEEWLTIGSACRLIGFEF